MSLQITVIGLDQVGSSIGLALAEFKDKILRVGHDPDTKRMKLAEKEGAFDKTFINLNDAVRGADIVILALPADMIKDTLSIISGILKADAVLINTSPIRSGINDWFKQYIPKECAFISVQPLIHADRLTDLNDELHIPRADLFINTEILITSDFDTSPKAVQVATDLVTLLKAQPYFADPAEADGIVARVEQLPQLAAAALVHTLVNQPGWKDGRRFSSRAFYRHASVSHLYNEQEFFGITDLLNKENVSRSLGEMITSLKELQTLIDEGNEDELRKYLQEVRDGYETWIEQRKSGDWDAQKQKRVKNLPARDLFSRMFTGTPKIRPLK